FDAYFRQHHLQPQPAKEGVYYTLERPGTGNFPKRGDYALVRFKAMLLDGTVFDQSEPGKDFVFQVGNHEVIRGFDRAVQLLKNGGKGTFYIPAGLGYRQQGVGDVVPPDSPLIYEVELLQIMDFEQYDKYMRELDEQERVEYERQQKEQFNTDLRLIATYAAAHHLKVKSTGSGLSYVITQPGKGENARPGDRLKVAYEGYLANGELFAKSPEGVPYEFFLGIGKVMDGWEEGLQFFNKGAEGWLLIPSRLGYGPTPIKEDNISIPANSVLVFKVKVVEVRKS
ncbi:MAG: FKBP-type peptidyl-prolyl cis-trans isomerase, partial [Saprospiraceae bacterium]